MIRKSLLFFLLALIISSALIPVQAQSNPNCILNPDGTITGTVAGGNEGGNGNGNGSGQPPVPEPSSCAPGEVRTAHLQVYEPEPGGTCTMIATIIDQCSGEVMEAGDIEYAVACPVAATPPANQPCQTLIGKLSLSNQGATGSPYIFQWEVPSHPAVGAYLLAGSMAGLEELPADMPLFVGHGHSAYKLFWNLSYDEYEAIKDCVPGPNGNGVYNCGGGTGHKDVVGYDWKHHSNGDEIPPTAVANLPASLKADLNGD